jgi:hypothetical protein
MSIDIIKSNKVNNELLSQVVDLINREKDPSFKRLHTFEYYNWKLRKNPNTSYIVVNYSNNELTGVLTFTAKNINKHSSNMVYELGDVYVDDRLKGRGVFFRMLRKFHKNIPNIEIYGTPNDLALPSELKAGYIQRHYNICYRFMPTGIPLFYYLSNFIKFLDTLHVFDNITTKVFCFIRYFFTKRIDVVKGFEISKLDIKKFQSSLFVKTRSYLQWRYCDSPEPYKYLSSLSGEDVLVYKEIVYRNIPFIMIVDHNIDSRKLKSMFLKQLLKRTNAFGIFEMSSNNFSSIMNNYDSTCIKDIKFITYNFLPLGKYNQNLFDFITGDGDSV